MAVQISAVCYGFLNSYAYGPPQYKEGLLLGKHDESGLVDYILASMPFPLRSSKNPPSIPGQEILGIYRCVPEREPFEFSLNDLLSIPRNCKYFCLAEYQDSQISLKLFRVNPSRQIPSTSPIEYFIFPSLPESDDAKEPHPQTGFPKDSSISGRLDSIGHQNSRLRQVMTKLLTEFSK
ncbi:unnamed protein product [Rodentolepis nana]|uniref:BAH domain-containing protein n=1 Tax=Rodentolepis nana TaxID=102285 RepID=A0A0R3T5V4_RODNA|nr:unnamed protein product [Rodentolepis nana]